ncbi:hypothetical protein MYX84_15115 [Acidobacteria bacterium AH-259-O06]|nr:hypothetical protein [Acidobacteria bacterium AH-259-O06]
MTIPSLTHQPQTVTQFDLKRLVSLSNQLEALKREHTELEQQFIAALSSGAKIEPGSHTAQLETSQRRNVSWKDVVIRLKGSGYAKNVLAHTKPTTYAKLVVR